jgi:hypothetical protein
VRVSETLGVVRRCEPFHLVVWAGAYPLIESNWELTADTPDDGKDLPKGLIYVERKGYYSNKEDAIKITNALVALKLGKSFDPEVHLKTFKGDPFVLNLVSDVPGPELTFYVN